MTGSIESCAHNHAPHITRLISRASHHELNPGQAHHNIHNSKINVIHTSMQMYSTLNLTVNLHRLIKFYNCLHQLFPHNQNSHPNVLRRQFFVTVFILYLPANFKLTSRYQLRYVNSIAYMFLYVLGIFCPKIQNVGDYMPEDFISHS